MPTVADAAALPGFEFSTWFGFVAPAKTPPQVLATLAQALQAVAEEPQVRQKLSEQGITPRLMVLDRFDNYIKAEIERLTPIAKASGVQAK